MGERDFGIDLHDRTPVHHGIFREGADAAMVVQRTIIAGKAPPAAEQGAGDIRGIAGSQRAARPSAQKAQVPQVGTKLITTGSPRLRSSTPAPTSSTPPRPHGQAHRSGRGRSPLMPERSEWQTPAAAIRTSTSPGPVAQASPSRWRAVAIAHRAGADRRLAQDGGADLHGRGYPVFVWSDGAAAIDLKHDAVMKFASSEAR